MIKKQTSVRWTKFTAEQKNNVIAKLLAALKDLMEDGYLYVCDECVDVCNENCRIYAHKTLIAMVEGK